MSPDVDAICAIWLVKRFLTGFSDAKIVYVPAGTTYKEKNPDNDPSILHLDTGLGKFDHHQTDKMICTTSLVYDFLLKEKKLTENQVKVVKRIVNQVNQIDHFQMVYYQDARDDKYEFFLESIIDGLKLLNPQDDARITKIGLVLFEGIFTQMTNKTWAEEIIEKETVKFQCKWGKALGFESVNDEALRLAQKMGYKLVVRRDPKKSYIRIKSWPDANIDLSEIYERLKEKDKSATWFLHSSKHMILNGSTKNPKMKPTSLSLKEIINIVKSI